MTIEQSIISGVRRLSAEDQKEVLDLIERLRQNGTPRKMPRPSLRGALAKPGRDITPEDIAEARREMWGRIIAATAHRAGIRLVTRDTKIRSAGIETIW